MSSEPEMEAEELPLEGAADLLRAAREAKGIELAHIAAETRIPLRHLEKVEAGKFEDLPSRTYALGFARNYAKQVGLDEEKIAGLVRSELADGHAHHSMIAGGMEPGDPAKLPSAGLAWFGAFAALLLAVGTIAFVSTYFGGGAELPSLLPDEEPETVADASGGETPGTAEQAGGAGPSASGQVVLTAVEGIWMRISEEDGERLYEGVLGGGETYTLPKSAQEPRINTGRPDLIEITIDGQSVRKLADTPTQLADEPVSASALLARTDTPSGSGAATN
ncbi:MAG: RodZ domain-containing protein [Pseudomonadota bacterium]